jgi:hypothetical protein
MEKLELTTIQDITNDFVVELKNKLKANDSYASGDLVNSIRGIVKQNGKYVVISIQLEDYWQYVENGRKAGKYPPINAIKNWISVKPVLPRPLKSGKLPTANQLAFLIARKISKVGIKPKPFLKPTITDFDLINKVYNEVVNLLNKQLEDLEV